MFPTIDVEFCALVNFSVLYSLEVYNFFKELRTNLGLIHCVTFSLFGFLVKG